MKQVCIAVTLLLISHASLAESDPLLGKFGHDYTRSSQEAVWQIRRDAGGYQLNTLTHSSKASAQSWSAAQRKAFWEKMMWPVKVSAEAKCVGNAEEVICYVPVGARKKVDWLRDNKSDYFHYDAMGGVMEAHRISG